MTANIDYDKIQRNLAVLMKNSVALSGKFYDLFVNTTPMDVELRVWTDEFTFESIVIPNLAKGSTPARRGEGNPEGEEYASYGALYLDDLTGSMYIKTTSNESASGWRKLVTSKELKAHDESSLSHLGYLAQINGSEDEIFRTKDLDPEETDNGFYAVNKNSLYVLLGGLENLETENNTDIVSSINEVHENAHCELGCVVRGNVKDSLTGAAAILTRKATNKGMTLQLTVGTGIRALMANGEQLTVEENVLLTNASGEIILVNDLVGTSSNRFCVYLDCTDRTKLRLVALNGNYYVDTLRPAFLGAGDVWMNVGAAPYSILVAEEKNNMLNLVERDYIYIGTVEVSVNE